MNSIDRQSLVEETQRILDQLLTPDEQKEMKDQMEEEIDKRLDVFFVEKCFYIVEKLKLMQDEISQMIQILTTHVEKYK